MDSIDELVIRIGADVKAALAGIARVDAAMENLDTQVGGAAKSIRSATAKIVTSLAKMGAAGAVGTGVLGTVMAKSAGDMESYMTTLEQLYGSQEEAGRQMAWLLDFAKSTPFEIPGLVDAVTKLKAYGIEGQEVLGTLGDTASAMGKPINMAVEALADAQTGEFERLKEFGIKAIQLNKDNAEQFGFTIADVGKTVMSYTDAAGKQRYAEVDRNNREIVTSTLTSIWNEKYAGGMKKQSQTLKGMVSNIKDSMYQAGLSVMGFNKQTGQFRPDSLFAKIKSGTDRVLDMLGEIDFEVIASKVEDIVDRIIEITSQLYEALAPTWENLKSMFGSIVGILKDIFAAFDLGAGDMSSFADVVNTLTGALAKVFKWIDEHPQVTKLAAAVGVAVVAFSTILPVLTGIIGTIGTVATAVGTFGTALAGGTSVMAAITTAAPALGAAIAALTGPIGITVLAISAFAGMWATNMFGIRDKTRAALAWIKEKFIDFVNWLGPKIEAYVNLYIKMYNGLVPVLNKAGLDLEKVQEVHFENLGNTVADTMGKAADATKSAMVEVKDSITGATTQAGTDLNTLQDTMNQTESAMMSLDDAWKAAGNYIGGNGEYLSAKDIAEMNQGPAKITRKESPDVQVPITPTATKSPDVQGQVPVTSTTSAKSVEPSSIQSASNELVGILTSIGQSVRSIEQMCSVRREIGTKKDARIPISGKEKGAEQTASKAIAEKLDRLIAAVQAEPRKVNIDMDVDIENHSDVAQFEKTLAKATYAGIHGTTGV